MVSLGIFADKGNVLGFQLALIDFSHGVRRLVQDGLFRAGRRDAENAVGAADVEFDVLIQHEVGLGPLTDHVDAVIVMLPVVDGDAAVAGDDNGTAGHHQVLGQDAVALQPDGEILAHVVDHQAFAVIVVQGQGVGVKIVVDRRTFRGNNVFGDGHRDGTGIKLRGFSAVPDEAFDHGLLAHGSVDEIHRRDVLVVRVDCRVLRHRPVIVVEPREDSVSAEGDEIAVDQVGFGLVIGFVIGFVPVVGLARVHFAEDDGVVEQTVQTQEVDAEGVRDEDDGRCHGRELQKERALFPRPAFGGLLRVGGCRRSRGGRQFLPGRFSRRAFLGEDLRSLPFSLIRLGQIPFPHAETVRKPPSSGKRRGLLRRQAELLTRPRISRLVV